MPLQLFLRKYGLLMLLVLIYLGYSVWRIWWFTQRDNPPQRWHAILWIYVSLTLVIVALRWLFSSKGFLPVNILNWFADGLLKIWISICILEFLIRLFSLQTHYSERRTGYYASPFDNLFKGWYNAYFPNSPKTLASGNEYSFSRHTNSLGFSDREWDTAKASGVTRVISFGDSFTEGDGAAYEDAYPYQLQTMLDSLYGAGKYEVFNAGICGSDPYFEYRYIKDVFTDYRPDVVLFTNSENDLYYDHLVCGGLKRFGESGKLAIPHQTKFWHKIYRVSHLFRMIRSAAGHNSIFDKSTMDSLNNLAIKDHLELMDSLSLCAKESNFKLIQLIMPTKLDLEKGEYGYAIDSLLQPIRPAIYTFDLLSYYRDTLHIPSEDYHHYFWRKDGHHNAKGYKLMARGALHALKTMP